MGSLGVWTRCTWLRSWFPLDGNHGKFMIGRAKIREIQAVTAKPGVGVEAGVLFSFGAEESRSLAEAIRRSCCMPMVERVHWYRPHDCRTWTATLGTRGKPKAALTIAILHGVMREDGSPSLRPTVPGGHGDLPMVPTSDPSWGWLWTG